MIPLPVILFIVVIIIAGIVLNRTYIGRHFYAIGSNEEAARLSGINTGKLKVATYAIGGFLSGLRDLSCLPESVPDSLRQERIWKWTA